MQSKVFYDLVNYHVNKKDGTVRDMEVVVCVGGRDHKITGVQVDTSGLLVIEATRKP